jgi:holo-[acyl-carrier protein] synthase
MSPELPPGGILIGLGADVIEVARIKGVLDRQGERFLARVFTEEERAYCSGMAHPHKHLAARFAAKEAVMKALGTGLGSFSLTDVEVRRAGGSGPTRGAPSLVLHGAAALAAEGRQVGRLHLSLTHTAEVAIAFVVAERGVPCSPS